MATFLLIVIYISFIGLGIPDSLFGTAWPAIYTEFNLPISSASFVTMTVSACTVISSLASAAAINRFGTNKVVAASTVLSAVTLLCFSFADSFLWLILLAIPHGFAAGCIDSGLNNYVALHYNAMQMNFLHCFYGIGVSVSPFLMSVALGADNDWQGGYRTMFLFQAVISLITVLALPLWNKAHPKTEVSKEDVPRTVSILQLMKIPEVRAVWIMFITTCAVEITAGAWSSTFLVNSRNMTAEAAARVVTLFYIGLTLGRFLSGLLAKKLAMWRLVQLGVGVVFLGILLVLLPLPAEIVFAGLFLIGLGVGPTFPNLTQLTPINFGRDISQSVIGSQMAVSYFGIMFLPPLFGLLAQHLSTDIFPWFLLLMNSIFVVSMFFCIKLLRKHGRYLTKVI